MAQHTIRMRSSSQTNAVTVYYTESSDIANKQISSTASHNASGTAVTVM